MRWVERFLKDKDSEDSEDSKEIKRLEKELEALKEDEISQSNEKVCHHEFVDIQGTGIWEIYQVFRPCCTVDYRGTKEHAAAVATSGDAVVQVYDRVCIKCNKCIHGEDEVYKFLEGLEQKALKEQQKQELAKKMWENCNGKI